jgi:hypothetical protein
MAARISRFHQEKLKRVVNYRQFSTIPWQVLAAKRDHRK